MNLTERYFSMTTMDWAVLGTIILLFTFLLYMKRLPSVDATKALIHALNSRGGNIIILTCLSLYFFIHSMRLFYHLLDMVNAKTLTNDNAFALMGLQFATSGAFGGAFGALLKTMTGESGGNRASDLPNGNGNGTPKLETKAGG